MYEFITDLLRKNPAFFQEIPEEKTQLSATGSGKSKKTAKSKRKKDLEISEPKVEKSLADQIIETEWFEDFLKENLL